MKNKKNALLPFFMLIFFLGCPLKEEKPLGPFPPPEYGQFALRGLNPLENSRPRENIPTQNINPKSSISGVLTLHPKIAALLPKEPKIIFIIARSLKGSPPLAVKRLVAKTFPLSFILSAKDLMQPGTPFKGEVKLLARIDQDGRAGPVQKGDFEGNLKKPIQVGTQNVILEINKAY